MDKNPSFEYTYSAERRKEIEAIRKKYLPKEEDKMEQLRKLHGSATRKAQSASIAIGVLKKDRERIAPEILRLTEELLK